MVAVCCGCCLWVVSFTCVDLPRIYLPRGGSDRQVKARCLPCCTPVSKHLSQPLGRWGDGAIKWILAAVRDPARPNIRPCLIRSEEGVQVYLNLGQVCKLSMNKTLHQVSGEKAKVSHVSFQGSGRVWSTRGQPSFERARACSLGHHPDPPKGGTEIPVVLLQCVLN